jgi:hypothetical protein
MKKTAQEVVDLINSGRGSEVGFYGEGIAKINEYGTVQVEVTTSPVLGDSPSTDISSRREGAMNIQRFSHSYPDPCLMEDKDGEWVRWEDVEELLRKIDSLDEIIYSLRDELSVAMDDIADLESRMLMY